MLSTGIFLNSIPLAQYAGGLSTLPYIIVGILLIPLIISMALLLHHHEAGNFYDIGAKEIKPIFGFLSTWIYFFAKPASAALMVHFFSFLICELFPTLKCISLFTLDTTVIILFILLNLLNMKIGRSIQISFILIKIIPLLFIIISGIWFLQPCNFAPINLRLDGIPPGLPLALFAFSGFEATLSISRHIKNPKRNAPRAIMFSYLIALSVYILYQLGYYAAINITSLTNVESFRAIAHFIVSICQHTHKHLQGLLYMCMGISALGGAYSVLFSNKWNLYTLASHKHTFFHSQLLKKNKAGIAYWCLLIESLIIFLYIIGTNANQIILQQISAFGCTLSYTISILAFVALSLLKTKKLWMKILGIFALINCLIFITSCINGFINNELIALYAFGGMVAFGIVMYMITQKQAGLE